MRWGFNFKKVFRPRDNYGTQNFEPVFAATRCWWGVWSHVGGKPNSAAPKRWRCPDFLGNTKWSFKHGEQNIEASILHQDWLNKYQQSQEIIINPQDALVCRVRTTVKHDENNDVISKTYEILEVKEIKRAPNSTQTKISF